MTAQQANADQIAYWNGVAGQKWVTAQDRLDTMLAEFSDRLLAEANTRAGERVLDIGCGCGATTLSLSKAGAVPTGLDVSEPMLARARHRAPGIEFLESDAATHAFKAEYDLLFSRFGVMFFDKPDNAFLNLRKALKPGGRLVFACWRDWRENEWVRVPLSAVRPLLPPQPQLGPEDPGPFSFADLARVRRILSFAGFDQITCKPFDTPMVLGSTLDDAIAHVSEIGPVSRMLTDATPDQRTQAVAALKQAMQPFAGKSPVAMGGAVWIVSAKA